MMAGTDRILAGRKVLLVEDEYSIARDYTSALEAVGAEVIGPTGSVHAAIDLIERIESIDGAILDINLQGVPAWPVADALIKRGVRFVFVSGYDSNQIPAHYDEIIRFEKPASLNSIAEALVG